MYFAYVIQAYTKDSIDPTYNTSSYIFEDHKYLSKIRSLISIDLKDITDESEYLTKLHSFIDETQQITHELENFQNHGIAYHDIVMVKFHNTIKEAYKNIDEDINKIIDILKYISLSIEYNMIHFLTATSNTRKNHVTSLSTNFNHSTIYPSNDFTDEFVGK